MLYGLSNILKRDMTRRIQGCRSRESASPTLSLASESVARLLSDHSSHRRAAMPRTVNKVILVGNVGKDPEVRYSQSGTPVANFSLATNEKFKERNDQWPERTEWHTVVAWKRLGRNRRRVHCQRFQGVPRFTSKERFRPQAGRICGVGEEISN